MINEEVKEESEEEEDYNEIYDNFLEEMQQFKKTLFNKNNNISKKQSQPKHPG
jgi:hypothetical protein